MGGFAGGGCTHGAGADVSRLRLCLLLLVLFLLSGCGGQQTGSSSSLPETQNPIPPTGLSGNFKQVAVVSFVAPTDGPEGFVDVTPGAVSDRERNEILSRAGSPSVQAQLEKIMGRHIPDDTHSHLYQFTIRQESIGGGFVRFVYGLDRLLGTAQPYIGFQPSGLFNRSPHNGITPRLPPLEEGSNHITITWTIPTDGTPTLVTIQPVDLRNGDIGPTVPAGTNEIVMDIDVTLQNGVATGTVTVNGQQAVDLSVAGAGINFYPMLRHPASGLFHCTMVKDGEVVVDESYLQRALVWQPVWPTIDRSTFEPISFSHRLVWDTGDPNVDSNSPRWRAIFPGASIPPPVNGTQPYQQGSEASFTYDPEHLSISGRAENRASGFRLAPDGGDSYSPSQERLLQAREAKTTYLYRVEADAVSFTGSNIGSPAPVDLRIQANASGMVPAKIPQLYVDNAKFTPNQTSPGQGSTFSADIITFFYDDPEIRWSYTLEGPDPEDPENLVIPYQTAGTQGAWQDFNPDFVLQIPWDGNGPSGEPGPAGSYQGTLTVDVREKTTGGFQAFHQEIQSLDVIGDQAVLMEIRDGDDDGILLASSLPDSLAPPIPQEDEVVDLDGNLLAYTGDPGSLGTIIGLAAPDLRFSKANNVFVFKEPGINKSLTLYLKNVPDPDDEDHIDVTVALTASQPSGQTVRLQRVGTKNGRSTYQRKLIVGEPGHGSDDPTAEYVGITDFNGFGSPFTTWDWSTNDGTDADSLEFIRWGLSFGNQQLGKAYSYQKWTAEHTEGGRQLYTEDSPTNIEALRSAGFETLHAVYGDQDAWLRIKNRAASLYISGEGWHDHGIELDGGVFAHPATPKYAGESPGYGITHADWGDSLRTVMVAGCSLFDIGNFNRYPKFEPGPDNQALVSNPGWEWQAVLGQQTLMLGYNSKAPSAAPSSYPDRNILVRYESNLALHEPPLAWLLANAADGDRAADDACAIQGDFYYFIKFDTDWWMVPIVNQPLTLGFAQKTTHRQCWRVFKPYWINIEKDGFDKIPRGDYGKKQIWPIDGRTDMPDAGRYDENKI